MELIVIEDKIKDIGERSQEFYTESFVKASNGAVVLRKCLDDYEKLLKQYAEVKEYNELIEKNQGLIDKYNELKANVKIIEDEVNKKEIVPEFEDPSLSIVEPMAVPVSFDIPETQKEEEQTIEENTPVVEEEIVDENTPVIEEENEELVVEPEEEKVEEVAPMVNEETNVIEDVDRFLDLEANKDDDELSFSNTSVNQIIDPNSDGNKVISIKPYAFPDEKAKYKSSMTVILMKESEMGASNDYINLKIDINNIKLNYERKSYEENAKALIKIKESIYDANIDINEKTKLLTQLKDIVKLVQNQKELEDQNNMAQVLNMQSAPVDEEAYVSSKVA